MSKPEPVFDSPASPGDPGLTAWELQDAHSGGVLDFARLLRVSSGFSFVVLQYNDAAYRDKVISYLDHHATSPAILALSEHDDVADFERHLFKLATDHDMVHVIGTHEWLAGEQRLTRLHGLNYHRELIADQARTVVAFWMIGPDIAALTLEAPDLWSWRKGVVDFSRTWEEQHELERDRIDLNSADLDERRERMAALQRYLAEQQGKTATRAGLLRELGQILDHLARPDEALPVFQEALAIYRGNDFKRDHAFVLGYIARIYVRKGDVDQALKLHQEELEVYENLGDKRSRAITLGDIARIYVSKGDVDQALKLHEEMLQVFESLGDKRSRAVTLGDIARIYVDKGDVDQALKLHEERLQVFESLGDLDGLANTLWMLAQINLQRKERQTAFDRLAKSYAILLKLGRLDGISYVGLELGQLLFVSGQQKEGLTVLARSEAGFRKLGWGDLAEHATEMMAALSMQTHSKKKNKKR
jgi:tetratricopeptide (TPR) repeat protein